METIKITLTNGEQVEIKSKESAIRILRNTINKEDYTLERFLTHRYTPRLADYAKVDALELWNDTKNKGAI